MGQSGAKDIENQERKLRTEIKHIDTEIERLRNTILLARQHQASVPQSLVVSAAKRILVLQRKRFEKTRVQDKAQGWLDSFDKVQMSELEAQMDQLGKKELQRLNKKISKPEKLIQRANDIQKSMTVLEVKRDAIQSADPVMTSIGDPEEEQEEQDREALALIQHIYAEEQGSRLDQALAQSPPVPSHRPVVLRSV